MPCGTTLRNFRAPDSLWQRARAVAARRGESLSDVLRAALERYVETHDLPILRKDMSPNDK